MALALKPSAILLGPLWAYAAAFRASRLRLIAGGATAAAMLNIVALPFWLTSGGAWLRTTYLANYVYNLHWSTMLTFNVWYAELLVNGVLDSRAPLFGIKISAGKSAEDMRPIENKGPNDEHCERRHTEANQSEQRITRDDAADEPEQIFRRADDPLPARGGAAFSGDCLGSSHRESSLRVRR